MAWRPTVAKSSGWSVAGEAEDGSPDDCGAPGPQVPVAALADRPARSSTPRAGRRQSGARSESRCRRSSPTRAQRAGVGGVSGGRAGATAAWQHPQDYPHDPTGSARGSPGSAAPGARAPVRVAARVRVATRLRRCACPSASRPAYADDAPRARRLRGGAVSGPRPPAPCDAPRSPCRRCARARPRSGRASRRRCPGRR